MLTPVCSDRMHGAEKARSDHRADVRVEGGEQSATIGSP